MRIKLRKRPHEHPDCERDADGADPNYMLWILSQVSSAGWAIPGVLGDGLTPSWAYSIGLWASFGHPDVAAFGLPLGELALIVKSLCLRVADEECLDIGDEIDGAHPARLAIRDVHDSWRTTPLFHASDQFHGYIRPPILQVVWADQDGKFPWDQRLQPALADVQPRLWLPVEDHPPGPWTRLNEPD
jgi:hypothetical protein